MEDKLLELVKGMKLHSVLKFPLKGKHILRNYLIVFSLPSRLHYHLKKKAVIVKRNKALFLQFLYTVHVPLSVSHNVKNETRESI